MVSFFSNMDARTHLYRLLPHHVISRLAYLWSQIPARGLTRALVRGTISAFVKRYNVDLQEAEYSHVEDYSSFAAFFTRRLRDEARKWPTDPTTFGSPVDGQLSEFGLIKDNQLIQAKGQPYSLTALLASPSAAQFYRDGQYATIYLSPGDYHRVHSPIDCTLTQLRYIPGRLWPVRPWAVGAIPGLFARNERLVIELKTAQGMPFILVMVGALMVGGLETVATGPVGHKPALTAISEFSPASKRNFSQGDELGQFNFGSTVILLWPQHAVEVAPAPTDSLVRLGSPIARLLPTKINR